MRTRRPRRHERGAALLTAMIIVTLVATLATSMVWQQWRAVQVESAERARVQSAWILSGALDFARLILREDQRSGRPTALTEPWATPLAEARLSTFLAVDKSNADDGPEAFLSGQITDAQSRYNLTNLIKDNAVDPAELATLEKLCQTVSVDASVATLIANGLLAASAPQDGTGTNAAAPLLPQTLDQLSWLGVSGSALQALRPYVVLLPIATKVNVNTAPREVLASVVKGLDLATAERLVQARLVQPFKDIASVTSVAPSVTPDAAKPLDVRSSFFEVRGRLRLVDRVLVEESLVQRLPNGQSKVLGHERLASVEPAGG